MGKKTFVLDTNVLLHDPSAMTKFPRSDVFIPIMVIEELDKMKRLPDVLGMNARHVFQLLDALFKENEGNFHQGITLQNGAVLKIFLGAQMESRPNLSPEIKKNQIIMPATLLQEEGRHVVFVSKDFAARVKAEAIGIEAEDYENLKFSYDSLYRGVRYVDVQKTEIDHFLKDGVLSLEKGEWRPNEYCVLKAKEHASAVGKFDWKTQQIAPLLSLDGEETWGIKPRNLEQRCAMDAMFRDEIKLVTLMGPAGTGKTLLALACAMRKVFDEGVYSRILISRPLVPLGKDIGYLPGTKEEKLFHWMQPIYDNLSLLCTNIDRKSSKETFDWLLKSSKIEIEAVTYIRGRSLPNVYIIIDEAQNLTPHEMKTIISRAGEGAKVVLTGDPTQIDNPYLDKDSNGMTYTVGRFLEQTIYSHIFLEKTERSQLAALAADIL